MHPKIIEFWEQIALSQNKRISVLENFGRGGIDFVLIGKGYKATDKRTVIAFSEVETGNWNTQYYFNGVEYTEAEMLKVIRIKSFT